jgi:hypothetical protein
VALSVGGSVVLTGPPAQLDDPLVQVARDVQVAGLEGAVLPERQVQASGHLHLTEPHLLPVSGEVLHDDLKHEPTLAGGAGGAVIASTDLDMKLLSPGEAHSR